METHGGVDEIPATSVPPDASASDSAIRLRWLIRVLALALLCGFLLSPKLWLSSRTYPLTPVADFLPVVPAPLDRIWFWTLLLLLSATAVIPRPRFAVVVVVVLAGLLSLWDQSRWQPWFYQYLVMLAALAIGCWAPAEPGRAQASLDVCRLIVASIYFWSGLQKLNFSFTDDVYPWLLEPMLPWLPESVRLLVSAGGLVAALLEAAIGLGLLVRPLRPVAVVLAVAMHLFIGLSLGPLGHNWNTVVWPWNVAMVAFVLLLFWRTPEVSCLRIVWPRGVAFARLTLLLFGILPALSFWSLWDSYLSATLYSGTTLDGKIYISDDVQLRLPDELKSYVKSTFDGRHRVDVDAWSIDELNVPPYPERRIYCNIARHLAAYADDPADVTLVIQERPDRRTGVRKETQEDWTKPRDEVLRIPGRRLQ